MPPELISVNVDSLDTQLLFLFSLETLESNYNELRGWEGGDGHDNIQEQVRWAGKTYSGKVFRQLVWAKVCAVTTGYRQAQIV